MATLDVIGPFGSLSIFMILITALFLYIFIYQRLYLKHIKSMLNHLDFPLWVLKGESEVVYCNRAYARFFEGEGTFQALKQSSLVNIQGEDTLRKTMIVGGERRIYVFRQKMFLQYRVVWGMDETQTESLNQELKRHAEAYREVLETLSAGIVIYGPDRRMRFYNQAYSRMFQFDRDWLDTSPAMGEILDDLRARRVAMEQVDYMAFRKREVDMAVSVLNPFEEMQHLPDGRSFRKIMAPHPLGGCFYIFEDVTNALTLERQYNTQIAVQKASLDNLYEGIAVFGSDNRLRLTNPAFEHLWQWQPKENDGHRHISELLDYIQHLFDYEGEWNEYKKKLVLLVTDRVPKSLRFFRKDGKVITFTYVPLPDGSHLMTYVDVTDTYQIESLLREKNQLLETTDRLKSEFIANISYELRNPLQAILGFTQLLDQERCGPLNDKQKNFTHHTLAATNSLLELVHTIVDLSTIESGSFVLKPKILDMNKIINSVVRISRPRAKQLGVILTVNVVKNLGDFEGDEARLKQALFGLLSYSMNHMQEGGEIHLEVYCEERHIVFTIQGAEEETLRAAQNSGGGLSLSLVKRLIELHKGTLSVQKSYICVHLPMKKIEDIAA